MPESMVRTSVVDYACPLHIQEALKDYADNHREHGHFVMAVLSNNLLAACASADHYNRPLIADIVQYVYNELPGLCWGSPAAVTLWLAGEKS